MKKVVLDTNVLISGIAFGGKPRKIMANIVTGRLRLALSEKILEELVGVLEGPKFRYPQKLVHGIADELRSIAKIVNPSRQINIIVSDPDDNIILECATAAGVDYIISGDRDILDLGVFENIPIVTPAKFVDEVFSSSQKPSK